MRVDGLAARWCARVSRVRYHAREHAVKLLLAFLIVVPARGEGFECSTKAASLLQLADGDDSQFIRSMAFVRVADVEPAFVFDGVGIAEIRVRGRHAGSAFEQ